MSWGSIPIENTLSTRDTLQAYVQGFVNAIEKYLQGAKDSILY